MGTSSSSTRKKIEAEFPLNGVQLLFLKDWTEKNVLIKETTSELCLRLKEEKTKKKKLTMLEFWGLKPVKANRFVSHSWSYTFRSVIDSLVDQETSQGNDLSQVYIWLDTLVVNQHLSATRTQGWWSTTFHGAIKEIGTVVLVIQPWHDPLALRRAWCLWEIYGSSINGSKFQIVLPKSEQRDFILTLATDFKRISQLLSLVDSSRAEAFVEADLLMIREAIKSSVGHEGINRMVLTQLRAWLVQSAKDAIADVQDQVLSLPDLSATEAEGLLNNQLARLCQQQGNTLAAIEYQTRAMEIDLKTFGDKSMQASRDMNNLGFLNSRLGNTNTALEFLTQAYKLKRELYGPDSPDTARTEFNIGELMEIKGDFAEAVRLYEHCLKCLVDSGIKDDAMKVYSGLAEVYRRMGDYSAAEKSFQSAVEFGENTAHPEVAGMWVSFAALLTDLDRFQEASGALDKAKVVLLRNLGESHTSIAEVESNRARLFSRLGRYKEAVSCQSESMRINVMSFGKSHLIVAKDANNLGFLYTIIGRLEEAETSLNTALAIRKDQLGAGHPYISLTMCNLAAVYVQKGMYSKAMTLYSEAQENITKLNPTHPNLAQISAMVGHCRYSEGKLQESLQSYHLALNFPGCAPSSQVEWKLAVAKVLTDLAEFDSAKTNLDLAKRVSEEVCHGMAENIFLVELHSGLARWQEATGDFEAAIANQRLAISSNKVPDSLEAARDANNLGFLLTEIPRSETLLSEGISCLERALDIRTRAYGVAKNPANLRTEFNLCLALFERKDEGIQARLEACVKDFASTNNDLHEIIANLGLFKILLFTNPSASRERVLNFLTSFKVESTNLAESHPVRLLIHVELAFARQDEAELEARTVAYFAAHPKKNPDFALFLIWKAELCRSKEEKAKTLDEARQICEELGLMHSHRYFERVRE